MINIQKLNITFSVKTKISVKTKKTLVIHRIFIYSILQIRHMICVMQWKRKLFELMILSSFGDKYLNKLVSLSIYLTHMRAHTPSNLLPPARSISICDNIVVQASCKHKGGSTCILGCALTPPRILKILLAPSRFLFRRLHLHLFSQLHTLSNLNREHSTHIHAPIDCKRSNLYFSTPTNRFKK